MYLLTLLKRCLLGVGLLSSLLVTQPAAGHNQCSNANNVEVKQGYVMLPCCLESGLKSERSRKALENYRVKNGSSGDRQLYWLDFDGERVEQEWTLMNPGGRSSFGRTFSGHAFVIADLNGACKSIALVTGRTNQLLITD